MKAAKWRDLSEDELLQKARDLSEEIFNLRFQLAMGVAKNPSRIGQARRDLARAYTIQRERGGAPLAIATPRRAGRGAPGPSALAGARQDRRDVECGARAEGPRQDEDSERVSRGRAQES